MRHLALLFALLSASPACDCNAPCPPAGIHVQAPTDDPAQITEVRVTAGAVCPQGPIDCGMSPCSTWIIPVTGSGTCTVQATYRSGTRYSVTVDVFAINTCCGERLAAGVMLPSKAGGDGGVGLDR